MPDICMCQATDAECRLAQNCYRKQATPTPRRQAYFVTPPFDYTKGTCEHYVPVTIDEPASEAGKERGE